MAIFAVLAVLATHSPVNGIFVPNHTLQQSEDEFRSAGPGATLDSFSRNGARRSSPISRPLPSPTFDSFQQTPTVAIAGPASWFTSLFDTTAFPPRWNCGKWSATHGWVHIISDVLIWAAYVSIPLILFFYVRKRRDLPFPRVFVLFALFILACGFGHLMEAIIFWWPAYRLDAAIKIVTATVSWLTVIALIPVIPKALSIPSVLRAHESLQREIAERNRVTAELNEREARYSGIVETAVDAIITIDPRGIIDSANGAAVRLFGWPLNDLVGNNVSMLMTENDANHHDEYVRAYCETGVAKIIGIGREIVGRRRDGTTFPADLAVSEVITGSTRLFTGVVRDITERKQARKLFRTTVDEVPTGILIVGEDGTIRLANARAEMLLGYDCDSLVGRCVDDLLPQHLRARHVAQRAEFFADPVARPLGTGRDLTGLRSDGTEIPVEVALTPVQIDGEQHALVMFADISERKLRETERIASVEALAKANGELRRKNDALDEFTYVASHDLQEPLRKLISFSALFKVDVGGDLPEAATNDLQFITDAAYRMQTLVQDLLALSRAGQKALKHESVSLGQCVDSALLLLSIRIEETSSKIVQDVLPIVVGDSTLLTQVFQNLISNAIKFVPAERTPQIDITCERADDQEIFGVRDNGIGINPEYAEMIFAPFKRLHGRSEYEGTGVGLAICKRAVERHGGRIWVESNPGEGSHFRFTLSTQPETEIWKNKEADALSCSL